MDPPSRQKRGLENGLFVDANGRETGNARASARSPEAVPEVARTKSNGSGTLPEPQPWAGLLALDGRMRVAFPSDDSGTIATTDVHHSGASAAEFHRLPDAPKVMGKIALAFFKSK